MSDTKNNPWFSARVRLICLVENGDPRLGLDTLYVFRAQDDGAAMARAIELAGPLEDEYKNEKGARVRWRVKEVISLDRLEGDEIDGREVFCEPIHLPDEGEPAPFDARFRPEHSNPARTVSLSAQRVGPR